MIGVDSRFVYTLTAGEDLKSGQIVRMVEGQVRLAQRHDQILGVCYDDCKAGDICAVSLAGWALIYNSFDRDFDAGEMLTAIDGMPIKADDADKKVGVTLEVIRMGGYGAIQVLPSSSSGGGAAPIPPIIVYPTPLEFDGRVITPIPVSDGITLAKQHLVSDLDYGDRVDLAKIHARSEERVIYSDNATSDGQHVRTATNISDNATSEQS